MKPGKDLLFHDSVGSAITGEHGRLKVTFDESRFRELLAKGRSDVFLKVHDGDKLLLDTRDSGICNRGYGALEIILRLPQSPTSGEQPPSDREAPLPPLSRRSRPLRVQPVIFSKPSTDQSNGSRRSGAAGPQLARLETALTAECGE